MSNKFIQYLKPALWVLALAGSSACTRPSVKSDLNLEPGVSLSLAQYRQQVISHLAYDLHFRIPADKSAPITATEVISFNLKEKGKPLPIDFKEQADHLQRVEVNGITVPIDHRQEHLVIPARALRRGANQIRIAFTAGDLSLNRNADYLYTLLVPDRARTVFPVFDQPSLKASFTLALTLPRDWQALANGPLQDSVVTAENKTYRFAPSDTISTYLFSFAAGRFRRVTREMNGRPMLLLHRETDADKLRLSLDPVFGIHADALQFMEKYTGIPYPFRKFDFVAIPDFQYGGMEHVGAIDYKAATLFLDEGATQDQVIARSSLIAHETAHMWFGDLVTMTWFNDVWMKEVFANFMADKITQVAVRNANYDLKFVVDHYPAAYGVDRTAGANPIRQELTNLQDAGTMYGNIIYHKAPIMMRQLERLMGETAFRAGLQEYLKTYAYGNATWPDLIRILDARTPADLLAWNQVWVNQPGRPVFDYDLQTESGKIRRLVLRQKAEDGSDRFWPQFFEVALVYPDRIQTLTVHMTGREVEIPEAANAPAPVFLLFNASGLGYGVFPVHPQLPAGLLNLPDPVARAAAYINLYENMLNGRAVKPRALLDLYRQALARETEELNLKLLTNQLGDLYWRLLPAGERNTLAATLEQELWRALTQSTSGNVKKLLFRTYQHLALTPPALDRLYQIWEKEAAPAGVKLSEDDYTALALALAVRDYPPGAQLLTKQLSRIKNPDRRKRLEFLMPALSPDVQVRDAFFASLKQEANREKEAWVVSALTYLHHPLRTAASEKYLAPSLAWLEEIQLTGDIFFPANWLQATFANYTSRPAAKTVQSFLAANPDYNPKLRAKILQAADDLLRAEKLLGQEKE